MYKNGEMKPDVIIFNVVFHFCIISCGNSIEFDNFYVEKSGHSKVKPGEIAVVFYITIANSGVSSKKIYSKNTKCCWIHPGSGSRYDCESMDLHGGMPVTLEPSKTANITYLFTNLYPLDRVGQCVFHLWHSKNKIAHTIRFNTTYQAQEQESLLGSLYKKIAGDGKKRKVCDTMDLDPRRNCKPVNCVQKYNGKRNFFRKETKLCEPVHECYTSKDDDGLPTTAFDKDHNKCKSLVQKELTKDEERDLKENVESHMKASEKAKFKNLGPSDPIPVRCNHGKRVGEICVCDDGWKTDTSNVPLGDPRFVYNWCNVRTRKKPWLPYKQQKHFMIAGLSLTSFTLLVTWLWMIHRYIYPQTDENEHTKLLPDTSKRVWKKTNLFATSKLLKVLAGRERNKNLKQTTLEGVAETTQLFEDPILTSVKDIQSVSPMKSKSVQKGKGALSFIKHSAKHLFSFRSLTNEKSNVQPGNIEDMVHQPSLTDESKPNISNVSTLAQYGGSVSAGDTTQDNSMSSSFSVPGRAVTQRELSDQMSQERSSKISNMFCGNISSMPYEMSHEHASNGDNTMVQQRSNSLPGKMSRGKSRNVSNTMIQQRSYSLPSKTAKGSLDNQGDGIETSVKQMLKDRSHVSTDEGVVKEPSRIVASRTTRAGSTYTLAGSLLTQKRLSTSTPVVGNCSDSD